MPCKQQDLSSNPHNFCEVKNSVCVLEVGVSIPVILRLEVEKGDREFRDQTAWVHSTE